MKKIIMTIAVLAGITATAQVKIGSNPNTLSNATSNFEVEGTTTAEQFVVLKNGRVGIGTTTPLDMLDVEGDISIGRTSATPATTNVIRRKNTAGTLDIYGGTTYSNGSKITLYGEDMTDITAAGRIQMTYGGGTAGSNGETNATFQVWNRKSTGSVTVMYADPSQRIGMGTITPTAKLHVVGEFRLDNATEGTGKVLTSDASGNATWQTANTNSVSTTAVAAGTTTQAVIGGNTEHTLAGAGVIMVSPDGDKWKVSVGNGGVLTIVKAL